MPRRVWCWLLHILTGAPFFTSLKIRMKTTHTLLDVRVAAALTAALAWPAAAQAQTVASLPDPTTQTAGMQALRITDLVQALRSSNKAIRSKLAESRITATSIERAQAAFQPTASVSAVRGLSVTQNTYEEELIRKNLGTYERESNDYNASVTQLLSTGAKLELHTSLSKFVTNNNAQDPGRPPGVYDNRTNYGFTLTQPLARDAGNAITMARVDVAKMDTQASEFAARDTETSVVAEAMMAYHELTFAQHRVQASQDKIANAKRLLGEVRAMNQGGRLPDADVWEVENALGRYQSGLSEALQLERERANRLRTMVLSVAVQGAASVRTVDALPEVVAVAVQAADSLQGALERRDDFRMRKVQAEREGVQLTYSQNQSRPRVDLVASYGQGALEYTSTQTFWPANARDYPTWTMGVQMSFPLGKNRQAQADIDAAVLRRDDALLALQALEVQIANDIDTSLTMLRSAADRWKLWHEVHSRETQQLQAEKQKFAAGRSDTREVLLREERVVNSLLSVLEQQLAYARADVMLQAAQGTLLDQFR